MCSSLGSVSFLIILVSAKKFCFELYTKVMFLIRCSSGIIWCLSQISISQVYVRLAGMGTGVNEVGEFQGIGAVPAFGHTLPEDTVAFMGGLGRAWRARCYENAEERAGVYNSVFGNSLGRAYFCWRRCGMESLSGVCTLGVVGSRVCIKSLNL